MADTELSVGKVDELKARLQHIKKIEEERIVALETLKQELEQSSSRLEDAEGEDEDEARRMAHDGQALVEQLDKRIKAMQRDMQDKKRSQELRKRQLLDERGELVREIAAEVEEMKVQATQMLAGASNGTTHRQSGSSSFWLTACLGLTVVCGVSCYAFLDANNVGAKLLPLLGGKPVIS